MGAGRHARLPDVPARERRLVFGEVAELYDAARPTYPEALITDLVAWASAGGGRPRALEVGAGTGKATRLLAAAGVDVLAIEPSAEMAAVARRTTAPGPGTGTPATVTSAGTVEVMESDFEHAELGGRRFPLVFAGQAWHWVTLPDGYVRAGEALEPGGRLVVFWNRPRWEESPLRAELNEIYEAHVPPELHGGPLHPATDDSSQYAGEEWAAEIAAVDGFSEAQVRLYDWSLGYTPDGYLDMLRTISEVRLLDPDARVHFLEAVHAAILGHGGAFTLGMQTRTCIARALQR
jgi:SAM-dependent methyltransferase